MKEEIAKDLIESQGYSVSSIQHIPEGRSHYGFDICFDDGTPAIARFEREREVGSVDGKRRDFHFNGQLSLEREKNLLEIVKNEADIPAPEVYETYSAGAESFMLVQKLPGVCWKEFLEETDYDLDLYLDSLRFLGSDIAQVQRVKFESHGDVMGRHEVQPYGIKNFADRLAGITDLKLQRAELSGALSEGELDDLRGSLERDLDYLGQKLNGSEDKPVLVLTDLHPMNFLVDDKGKPSGYFDLEFSQAGMPALEFYALKYGLFNYFDKSTFEKAEDAFFDGFEGNGGKYVRTDPVNLSLERTLSVGHLLGAVTSYHGASDGLRDTWSDQFKDIMFDAVQNRDVDYVAISDVPRQKTGQPKHPTVK